MSFDIKDLLLSVTNFCLGSCVYCNLKSLCLFDHDKEIIVRDVEKLFRSKYLNGLENIHLTGGEPILSPKLWGIVSLIREYHKDVRVNIPVSGFFPYATYRYIKKIQQVLPQIRVDISIDATTKEVHEKTRGQGSWESLLKTIELLRTIRDLKLQMQLTLMNTNYTQIKPVQNWANDLGMGFYLCFPRWGTRFGHEEDKSYEHSQRFIDEVEKQIIDGWCKIRPLNMQIWTCQKAIWQGKKVYHDCLMGQKSIDVDPQGNVYPCFIMGQNLLTSCGYITMDDSIMNKSYVLITNDGEDTSLKTMKRNYDGEVIAIKPECYEEIVSTPEHPFLIVWKHRNKYSKPEFVNATNLVMRNGHHTQYLCIKHFNISKEITLDFLKQGNTTFQKISKKYLDKDFAWLCGWYVAEGSLRIQKNKTSSNGDLAGAVFTLNNNKDIQHQNQIMNILRNLGLKPRLFDYNNYSQITVYSKALADLFNRWFGNNSHTKHLPKSFLYWKEELIEAFMDGYWLGDGYEPRKGYKSIKSVSKELVKHIQLWLLKIGYRASFSIGMPRTTFKQNGDKIESSESYSLSWTINKKWDRLIDGLWLFPIKRIEKRLYKGKVYNLETLSNTYSIPFIVHNCMCYYDFQKFGNIKEQILTEILESERVKSVLQDIKDRKCQPCIMPVCPFKSNFVIEE